MAGIKLSESLKEKIKIFQLKTNNYPSIKSKLTKFEA